MTNEDTVLATLNEMLGISKLLARELPDSSPAWEAIERACKVRDSLTAARVAPPAGVEDWISVAKCSVDERSWPEDRGDRYANECVHCQRTFYGNKRRVACKACAAPPQVEQQTAGADEHGEPGTHTHMCPKCVEPFWSAGLCWECKTEVETTEEWLKHQAPAQEQGIGPTYYVRHPGDRYSVADPQPSPRAEEAAPTGADHRRDMNLRMAARAVVDRWETPLWKDVEHTGTYIDRLRDALIAASDFAAAPAPAETAGDAEPDNEVIAGKVTCPRCDGYGIVDKEQP